MGKIAPIKPAWVASLDLMIEYGIKCRVICSLCRACRDIDLEALREKVGGSYSLWNRRCRCRLTPGCRGWNMFMHNGHGGFYNIMRDPDRDWWDSD